MTYKWESPLAWLIDYLGKLDSTQLFNEAAALAQELDGDQIQDLYQNEMDKDGYFEKVTP